MNKDIVTCHNPECGTSRNAPGMTRNARIEPHAIEYLMTPASCTRLENPVARAEIRPRDLLRAKTMPFAELGQA